jgi:hypothetical protein
MSEYQKNRIQKNCNNNGVELNGNELIICSDMKNVGSKIRSLVQAMLAIDAMYSDS